MRKSNIKRREITQTYKYEKYGIDKTREEKIKGTKILSP